MRGKPQAEPEFLTIIHLNQRVPAGPPLRGIKKRLDKVLAELSPLLDAWHRPKTMTPATRPARHLPALPQNLRR